MKLPGGQANDTVILVSTGSVFCNVSICQSYFCLSVLWCKIKVYTGFGYDMFDNSPCRLLHQFVIRCPVNIHSTGRLAHKMCTVTTSRDCLMLFTQEDPQTLLQIDEFVLFPQINDGSVWKPRENKHSCSYGKCELRRESLLVLVGL